MRLKYGPNWKVDPRWRPAQPQEPQPKDDFGFKPLKLDIPGKASK